MDTRAIPVRQYLEATVVPLMMQVRLPLHSSCKSYRVTCEIAGMVLPDVLRPGAPI